MSAFSELRYGISLNLHNLATKINLYLDYFSYVIATCLRNDMLTLLLRVLRYCFVFSLIPTFFETFENNLNFCQVENFFRESKIPILCTCFYQFKHKLKKTCQAKHLNVKLAMEQILRIGNKADNLCRH